jgi:putative nucleotidyltransferase with HDIG domain
MGNEHNRVLIVDDEPQIVALIREELAGHGFVCWTAGHAAEARAFLESRPVDVLIADIEMPQASGMDLIAYVREQLPGCRVVLITGKSKREYLSQAMLLGAYDYVEKPFRDGELVEVIRGAVNHNSALPRLLDRAAAAMDARSEGRRASLDSVAALIRAVEAKDPYTRHHSEHVARYAVAIGAALGVRGTALESLRIAALLHDIGKIGVPDRVLTKPGPLTSEEFEHIRRHPSAGADILGQIEFFRQEAQVVRFHHERWDGKGYPSGLIGEESPFAARIIQVADSMDAMLMERTYRGSYPPSVMLGELVRCSGTQFDPKVAAATVRWCQNNPDRLFLPGQHVMAAAAIA